MARKKTKRRLRIFGVLLSKEDSNKIRKNAKYNGLSISKYIKKKTKEYHEKHYIKHNFETKKGFEKPKEKVGEKEKDKRIVDGVKFSKEAYEYLNNIAKRNGLTFEQYIRKFGAEKVSKAIQNLSVNEEIPFHVKHFIEQKESSGYRYFIECQESGFEQFNMFCSMFYVTFGDEIYLRNKIISFEFLDNKAFRYIILKAVYLADDSAGTGREKIYEDNCVPSF